MVDIGDRLNFEAARSKLALRVRTLIDHSQEGVFVMENERYLYVNSVYAHMLGYEPGEMIGEEVAIFFAPDERKRVEDLWNQRSLGFKARSSYETRLLHKDGETQVPVAVSSRPIDNLGEYVRMGTVHDLTAERKSQRMAYAAEERLHAVIEYASVGIYRSTPDGKLLSANRPLAKMFGYDSLEDFNDSVSNVSELYADREHRDALLKRLEEAGSLRNVELRMKRRDGAELWLLESSRVIHDDPLHPTCFEGMLLDITERKSFENRLRYQANHDPLTGLPNRLLMRKKLAATLEASRQANTQQGAVFLINLSAARKINDSLGPDQADHLLKQAAKRLFNLIGDQGEVSRQEGSEFVVLAPNITETSEAESLAQRIKTAFEHPFMVNGYEIHTRLLIGIVLCHPEYEAPETVLRDADAAMMECKRRVTTQSGYVFFDATIRAAIMSRLELEMAMREGLERDEFDMHYQPACEISTGRPVFFEALIRWHHPQKGLLEPASFLPIAEETGLIVALGWNSLGKVVRDCAAWQSFSPGMAVAFNLSHQEFYSPQLEHVVAEALGKSQLPAHLLHLELTEEVFMGEPNHAQSILERLHALGVRVHLDDFGTGYSSFSYLNQLPIDALKIDRTFVERLVSDQRTLVITRNIINLARDLQLGVIAEGVERQEEAQVLTELGCDVAQGHFFGKAMDAQAATERLKTGR